MWSLTWAFRVSYWVSVVNFQLNLDTSIASKIADHRHGWRLDVIMRRCQRRWSLLQVLDASQSSRTSHRPERTGSEVRCAAEVRCPAVLEGVLSAWKKTGGRRQRTAGREPSALAVVRRSRHCRRRRRARLPWQRRAPVGVRRTGCWDDELRPWAVQLRQHVGHSYDAASAPRTIRQRNLAPLRGDVRDLMDVISTTDICPSKWVNAVYLCPTGHRLGHLGGSIHTQSIGWYWQYAVI